MGKRNIKLPYAVAGTCFHIYVEKAPVDAKLSFKKHKCDINIIITNQTGLTYRGVTTWLLRRYEISF